MRSRRRSSGVGLLAAGWLLVGVAAHQAWAQQPETPTERPVFRTGVEVVRLDLRVLDADGRPVSDITQEEVQVLEGGNPRPIMFFQRVTPTPPYLEAARRAVAAEVSSNDGAPRGQLFVIVFDTHHIAPGNETRARTAVERFLRSRVRPGDRASLYALPGPGPVIPFTSDVSKLTAQLPRIVGSLERTASTVFGNIYAGEARAIAEGDPQVLDRVTQRLRDEAGGSDLVGRAEGAAAQVAASETPEMFARLLRENARTIIEHQDQEARSFLLMLADIVRDLSTVDGRKSIVLFSEGFFIRNVMAQLDSVAAAAARSSSAIYAFDLNDRLPIADTRDNVVDSAQEIQDRLQALSSLALETNGELFTDAGNQLDRALGLVASQSEDYYVVGFEPSRAALDNRDAYRRVEIKVARPGTRVSSRTGYAMKAGPTPADRRKTIDSVLASPFTQRGLPVEYTTYVLRGTAPGAHQVFVSLKAMLPVAAAGDSRTADVVFVVRSIRDGRTVASGSDTITLPPAADAGSTAGAGRWRVQFELPPGEYIMRVVVREPGGIAGSADRRFDVRPLSGAGMSASDLVLGGSTTKGLPVRASAYTSEVLTGALEVYGRTPEQLSGATVKVELAKIGGESAVRVADASLAPAKSDSSGASRSAGIEMPLEDVAPGVYVAKATVRAQGEVVAELFREVEVIGGHAPAPEPADAAATRGMASVEPMAVLSGEIGRRYVQRVSGRLPASQRSAGDAALAGQWNRVATLLSSPADAAAEASALAALAAFAGRDFATARTGLDAVFAASPTDGDLAFLLGWSAAASGDDRSAVTAWRNAVRADPRLVPAYLALADAYLRLGQPALAIQSLKSGLSAVPGSPELRARLEDVEGR